MNDSQYDYIITGAGAAGLSLLYRMLRSEKFNQKRFLLIDKTQKNHNDRTWCFWEKENDLFEPVVFRKWNQLDFFSDEYKTTLDISPYQYKMIRGIDFYNFCFEFILKHTNVDVLYDEVIEIKNHENAAIVKTQNDTYRAQFVFNSILREIHRQEKRFYFLQHFKGLTIQTTEPVFKNKPATLMDFRIEQKNDTRFIYALPFDDKNALVEYTVFSEKILNKEEYDNALKNYIREKLKCSDYKITSEEFGVIPMTNASFKMFDKRIVNIGTAGGMTKASTGYTFQFIQQQTKQLCLALEKTGNPYLPKPFSKKRFDLYDTVLLHILYHHQLEGKEIFKLMFQKNKASIVLAFLENKTSFAEELKIFSSLPKKIFMKATLKSLNVMLRSGN